MPQSLRTLVHAVSLLYLHAFSWVQKRCIKENGRWKEAIKPVKYDDFILRLCWDPVRFSEPKWVCVHRRLTIAKGNAQAECYRRQQLRNVLFTYLLETQDRLKEQVTPIPISKQFIGKIRKIYTAVVFAKMIMQYSSNILNTKRFCKRGKYPISLTHLLLLNRQREEKKIQSNLIILAIGCCTCLQNDNYFSIICITWGFALNCPSVISTPYA